MRLLMFDCDGTIVDSQNAIVSAMAAAFAAEGLAPPPRAGTLGVVGLSLLPAIQRLAPQEDLQRQRALVDRYRTAAAQVRAAGAGEPLFPGAAQTIASLAARRDTSLGIATGKSRRGVDRLLAENGWQHHFATIQTADDNPSKPHPAMVERAIAETGAQASATVLIGDTTFDMEMAKAAGAAAIGVSWGYHPVADLIAAGADMIVDTYAALEQACDDVLGGRVQR